MKYKKSKYNIIINRPQGCFLWNTYSNAFIRLNDDGMKWLDAFDGTQVMDPYFSLLEKNGCIVREALNETGKILYEEKNVMLDSMPESMHFTIAPGLGCNYKCVYCFEKDHVKSKAMNSATIKAVTEYIIKKMTGNPKLKRLEIRWFGGEPLLCIPIIESISKILMDWCMENEILYSAGIVTNGRYLDRNNAERLKKLRVDYVQLSMDGMRDYYEQQKGAQKGDFDAVVDNLKASSELLNITVRINIDESLDEALALTEYLLKTCGLDGKIRIYVAHVRYYEGKTALDEKKAHAAFLEMEGHYMGLFGEDGPYRQESLAYILPKRRCTTCKSVCGSNFCIGPEGELYRCEHHYGMDKHVVGNVMQGLNYTETEMSYLKYRHLDQCLECRLFPVCLGGCMNDNKEGTPVLKCDAFLERQVDYLLKAYS